MTALPNALLRVLGSCHTLRFADGKPVGDPMEIALWDVAAHANAAENRRVWSSEIAFDADRKHMSVIVEDDAGRVLYCKGAP